MRSTVRSILVCSTLFTLGCDDPTPTETEGDGWRGAPGFSRPEVPTIDSTTPPSVSTKPGSSVAPPIIGARWTKLPVLATNLPPKLVIGPDLRPIVLHTHVHPIAGQTLINLDVSRHDGQGWVRYPTISETDSGHHGYSVALGSDGGPVVAWTEATRDGNVVRVSSFDGADWNHSLPPLRPTEASAGPATDPMIRLDEDDRPFIAWRERLASGSTTIVVAAWNGTEWDRTVPPLAIAHAQAQGLVVRDRAITVGWESGAGSGVSGWNGNGWAPRPTSSPPLAIVPGTPLPRMAQGPDGTRFIAWLEGEPSPRIRFARWAGSAWAPLPIAVDLPALPTTAPEVAIDPSGALWVAWTEDSGTRVNVWTWAE